jgi:hypothetical protein
MFYPNPSPSLKVYLAGPITSLTYDDAQDWRDQFAQQLESDGEHIKTYTPLRMKEHLRSAGVLKGYDSHHNWVVTRDRWDVATADIVVANLAGATVASVGTISEITQAADNDWTFTIVVLPGAELETNPHHHIFIYHLADAIVENLDEALELIHAL